MGELTVRAGDDDWQPGSHVLDGAVLKQIREVLEETPLIVEHGFYRGARSPERRIFESFREFEEYLRVSAAPGDAIWAWRYDALCKDDNAFVHGKLPDSSGAAPIGGAY